MSLVLVLGCFWVIAATFVAFLPMRWQFVPGLALLLAAPVLIWMIGQAHGWVLAGAGTFAFLSMFRRPIRYFAARMLGRTPEVPK